MASGVTVSFGIDTKRADSAVDKTKAKIIDAGHAAGKSFEESFTKAEIALGKMVIKATFLKKAVQEASQLMVGQADSKVATSEKYGGRDLRVETVGRQSGLGVEETRKIISGYGATSADDMLNMIDSFSETFTRTGGMSKETKSNAMKVFAIAKADPTIPRSMVERAIYSGDSREIEQWTAETQKNMSAPARREVNVMEGVNQFDTASEDIKDAGAGNRMIKAAGDHRQRENPMAYGVLGALGLGDVVSRLGGTVDAFATSVETSKMSKINKPNYSGNKDP